MRRLWRRNSLLSSAPATAASVPRPSRTGGAGSRAGLAWATCAGVMFSDGCTKGVRRTGSRSYRPEMDRALRIRSAGRSGATRGHSQASSCVATINALTPEDVTAMRSGPMGRCRLLA